MIDHPISIALKFRPDASECYSWTLHRQSDLGRINDAQSRKFKGGNDEHAPDLSRSWRMWSIPLQGLLDVWSLGHSLGLNSLQHEGSVNLSLLKEILADFNMVLFCSGPAGQRRGLCSNRTWGLLELIKVTHWQQINSWWSDNPDTQFIVQTQVSLKTPRSAHSFITGVGLLQHFKGLLLISRVWHRILCLLSAQILRFIQNCKWARIHGHKNLQV